MRSPDCTMLEHDTCQHSNQQYRHVYLRGLLVPFVPILDKLTLWYWTSHLKRCSAPVFSIVRRNNTLGAIPACPLLSTKLLLSPSYTKHRPICLLLPTHSLVVLTVCCVAFSLVHLKCLLQQPNWLAPEHVLLFKHTKNKMYCIVFIYTQPNKLGYLLIDGFLYFPNHLHCRMERNYVINQSTELQALFDSC